MSSPDEPTDRRAVRRAREPASRRPAGGARVAAPAGGSDRRTTCRAARTKAARDVGARAGRRRARRWCNRRRRALPTVTTHRPIVTTFEAERASTESLDSAGIAAAKQAPIAPAKRAQLYSAEITLRVRRALGDDASCSSSDAGARRLRAQRRLRRGRRKRHRAARLARADRPRADGDPAASPSSGTILDQHVSVRDAQARLDRRFKRIAELRRAIPTLSGEELAAAQAELDALQTAQGASGGRRALPRRRST